MSSFNVTNETENIEDSHNSIIDHLMDCFNVDQSRLYNEWTTKGNTAQILAHRDSLMEDTVSPIELQQSNLRGLSALAIPTIKDNTMKRITAIALLIICASVALAAQDTATNINSVTLSGNCDKLVYAGKLHAYYNIIVGKHLRVMVQLDIPVDFKRIKLSKPLSIIVQGYMVQKLVNGRRVLVVVAEQYKWFNVKKGNSVTY